jgi:hypothetical protein
MSKIMLLIGLSIALLSAWNMYASIRSRENYEEKEKEKVRKIHIFFFTR